MSTFIIQFIRDSQVKYPLTSQNPFKVLFHLFFFKGNGFRYDNNDFVDYKSEKPLKELFKKIISTNELIELYDKKNVSYKNERIQTIFEQKQLLNNIYLQNNSELYVSEDLLLKAAEKEYDNRYDNVDFIDNYLDKDLFDPDTFYLILKNNYKFVDFNISNSVEFEYLSETDIFYIKLLEAFILGYIKYLEDILETRFKFKFLNFYNKKYNQYEKDLLKLKDLLKSLNKIKRISHV